MSEFNDNDLFDSLDESTGMSFLEEKASKGQDGLYRIDLKKVKDMEKGYRAKIRFLPNLLRDGKTITDKKTGKPTRWGENAYEKITHYADIKQVPELSGYFDSPRSIDPYTGKYLGETCLLTKTYYDMINSKNATLIDRAKLLKYSKKYYSYVLILEDEQQPELVGKIMIFQYGKTIFDKIKAEDTGEITGEKCNVFSMKNGKDFRLIVKETGEKDEKYPDYKMCAFLPSRSTMSISSNGVCKNLPLDESGNIPAKLQGKVAEFLQSSEVSLDEFAPKPLTEQQIQKISDIIAFLTGKSSNSAASQNLANKIEGAASVSLDDVTKATSGKDDFDFETESTGTSTETTGAGKKDEWDFDDL